MTVLNKYKTPIPKEAVYIGRGSIWGNPFPLTKENTREEVVGKYRRYLVAQLKNGIIPLESIKALYGKDLVCYCAPKLCHGDVLEEFAKKLSGN